MTWANLNSDMGRASLFYAKENRLKKILTEKITHPSIAGDTAAGSVLTMTSGTFTNSDSLENLWKADGEVISGETGLTYTTANPGDIGKEIIGYQRSINTQDKSPYIRSSNSIIVT